MKISTLRKKYPTFFKPKPYWYFIDKEIKAIQFTDSKLLHNGYFFIKPNSNFEVFEENQSLIINDKIALHLNPPLKEDDAFMNVNTNSMNDKIKLLLKDAINATDYYLSPNIPLSYNDDFAIFNQCCLIKLK